MADLSDIAIVAGVALVAYSASQIVDDIAPIFGGGNNPGNFTDIIDANSLGWNILMPLPAAVKRWGDDEAWFF